MPLTRDDALARLHAWTDSPALRIHALAVEHSMRFAAPVYGGPDADVDQWGLAGLLHDADYDRWPQDHPQRIVAWLRDRDEHAVADAIAAHYTQWGVPAETPLARGLLACDELTGFVMACCFVRPEGISTLTPKSVKKKLKSRGFAAGVDRAEVQAGLELVGAELGAHIQLIIDALKPHAEELGIQGKGG